MRSIYSDSLESFMLEICPFPLIYLFIQSWIYFSIDSRIFILQCELSYTMFFLWFLKLFQIRLLGALSDASCVHLTNPHHFVICALLYSCRISIFPPRSSATIYWRMILETKTQALDVFVATGESFF